MTEGELRKLIDEGTGISNKSCHPSYLEHGIPLHPDEPVDYDKERMDIAQAVLGQFDFTYKPALGSPHVEIHRFPIAEDRPFCCYLTSGISDFSLIDKTGKKERIELLACTSKPDSELDMNSRNSLLQVIRYIALFPFMYQTTLGYGHTVDLPSDYSWISPNRIFLTPPFLLKDLAYLSVNGEKVTVIGMIQVNESEFNAIKTVGARGFMETLPDCLETWLLDTKRSIPSAIVDGVANPKSTRKTLLQRIFGR